MCTVCQCPDGCIDLASRLICLKLKRSGVYFDAYKSRNPKLLNLLSFFTFSCLIFGTLRIFMLCRVKNDTISMFALSVSQCRFASFITDSAQSVTRTDISPHFTQYSLGVTVQVYSSCRRVTVLAARYASRG